MPVDLAEDAFILDCIKRLEVAFAVVADHIAGWSRLLEMDVLEFFR